MVDTQETQRVFQFGWKEAGVVIAGFFIAQLLLGLPLLVFGFQLGESPYFLLVSYVVSFSTCILALYYGVIKPSRQKFNLGFSRVPRLIYLIIFPLMLGVMLINECLTNLLPTTGPFWGEMYQTMLQTFERLIHYPYLMVFMTSICAPILEELLFRGIIQRGLVNKGISVPKAIFYSAFVFGLVHGNPWQFLGATLMGCVLGYAYHLTHSIIVPILLHAFNNFIATLLMIGFKEESIGNAFGISEAYLLITGAVLFGVFGFLLVKQKNKLQYTD